MRAGHEQPQKLRPFFQCHGGWGWEVVPLQRFTSVSDHLWQDTDHHDYCHNISKCYPALGTSGTCSIGHTAPHCCVGHIIRTHPRTHPWSGWSLAMWCQPSHWTSSSNPSSGQDPWPSDPPFQVLATTPQLLVNQLCVQENFTPSANGTRTNCKWNTYLRHWYCACFFCVSFFSCCCRHLPCWQPATS